MSVQWLFYLFYLYYLSLFYFIIIYVFLIFEILWNFLIKNSDKFILLLCEILSGHDRKAYYHLIGHQLPASSSYNMESGGSVLSPVGHGPDMQKQPADQHKLGLASNFQEDMHLDVPSVALQGKVRHNLENGKPAVQPIIGIAEVSGIGY